jgi:hypothetical protein
MTNKMSTEEEPYLWAQSNDVGVVEKRSLVHSNRFNKTPTRDDERRERGKARCCLLGLLET